MAAEATARMGAGLVAHALDVAERDCAGSAGPCLPVLGACARWLPRPVFGLVMAAVPGRAVLCATLWRFVSCVLVLCVGPGPSLCL